MKEASNFQSCPPQQKVGDYFVTLFFFLENLLTLYLVCFVLTPFILSRLFFYGFQEELWCLCSELETHVKCHIRESEKCLYRTRVSNNRGRNLYPTSCFSVVLVSIAIVVVCCATNIIKRTPTQWLIISSQEWFSFECAIFYTQNFNPKGNFSRHPVLNDLFRFVFKVKDLVARIDIKWQILLHGTKPLDVSC